VNVGFQYNMSGEKTSKAMSVCVCDIKNNYNTKIILLKNKKKTGFVALRTKVWYADLQENRSIRNSDAYTESLTSVPS